MMHGAVHRFRMAVVPHLGRPITPELAAHLEVQAFGCWRPEPQEHAAGAMTVRIEQRQEYLDFLNDAFGTHHRMEQVRLLAVLRGAAVAAVLMYSRITRRSCEMTVATDGGRDWATRATLRHVFGFPFQQLGLHRATVVVRKDNEASLSLCRRLGYVPEGCVREAFDDGTDGIVMGMLRRECRWIGEHR